MKILVTGCAGFIGSHLCEKLLFENNTVIGIDNLNDSYDVKLKNYNLSMLLPEENFTFIKEDICISDCINKFKPDKVVHLAGLSGIKKSIEEPNLFIKNNIMGTINLLNQSVSSNVKLFVYASSSSVYGLNTIPFREEDKIDNMNSQYAVSKKSIEDYCKLYSQLYKLNTIGLRLFNVYGPSGRPDMVPFTFLKNIYEEKEIKIYGDGYSIRDYTYIDDIIDGIILSLENKNNDKCEIYNLGNNYPVMLNSFIEYCEKIVGKKAKKKYIEKQIGDINITMADITKAKSKLGYEPKIKLLDGLKKTFQWIKLYN